MKIKPLFILTVLVVAFFCFGSSAKAITADTQAQIAQLQAQIQALLALQQSGPNWCYTFNTDFGVSQSSVDDVTALNTALSKEGLNVNNSSIFSEDTAAAVVQFQAKYGIKQTGYVGPATRTKLNALYGCGTHQPIQPAQPVVDNSDAIAKKVVDYVNSSGLSATPASLVSAVETDGLVKVSLQIGTSQFDSYATNDGQLLFPQAYEIGNADTALSSDAVAQKAIDYINSKGLTSTPASLISVGERSGLVEIKMGIGANNFDSYATNDGQLLFPQVFDMTQTNQTASNQNTNNQTRPPASITKTSNPSLEAFVVSSCPYGLQMQRAIVDAVKNIPALASNITVRYIGSVNSSGKTIDSMHGPEEGAENLRQICIREEQPLLYWNYIGCYMQKIVATASSGMPLGDSPSCQASTGVDTAKLAACVADPSRGVAYAQKDFAEDLKYNISGSPTLILNGTQISETSFGGRSSDAIKSMVCAAFSTQPSFCSQKLNTTEAATSFSSTYSTNSNVSSTPSGGCAIPNS